MFLLESLHRKRHNFFSWNIQFVGLNLTQSNTVRRVLSRQFVNSKSDGDICVKFEEENPFPGILTKLALELLNVLTIVLINLQTAIWLSNILIRYNLSD